MGELKGGTLPGTGTPLFLGRDPASTDLPWAEWQIQAYCVMQGRRAGYLLCGGMEQGKRSKASGSRAKATGLTKGWPDTTWLLPDAKVVFIEYKIPTGRIEKEQREMAMAMLALGHRHKFVIASSPAEGWEKTKRELW